MMADEDREEKAMKKKDSVQKSIKRAKSGAILLAIAVFVGILFAFVPLDSLPFLHKTEEAAAETPKVIYIAARPSAEPTATPTVTGIKVSTFGAELTSDGFTTYVGDKAVVLSATIEPSVKHPPVFWSVSDPESASLAVSDDRMSCEFTALKPSGKNELIVSCYGAEVKFPVYLWKR